MTQGSGREMSRTKEQPCWLCGHVHPEDGAYGCLQTRVAYGASSISCYCPLKPAWERDPTKRHRAGAREILRPLEGGTSYWAVCNCGWEGLSYYRRKPATEAKDGHLADIAQALIERAARPSDPAGGEPGGAE